MTQPPCEITSSILHAVAEISEKIGAVNAAHLTKPSPELRKQNKVKTIHASLGIEGNALSVEQVSAILENKIVAAPAKDVLEVKNAVEVYDRIGRFKPGSVKDFCRAHGLMMKGLLGSAGKFRSHSVGIMMGGQLAHLAPPAIRVPVLMDDLFGWLKKSPELPLVKSCVFHYETEFIHPFMDGNGRMGRLWQTVILLEKHPVFEFLPVETIIKKRQREYCDVLSRCDRAGISTEFVGFMLGILNQALGELLDAASVRLDPSKRMELFRSAGQGKPFSRKDYLRHFKNISTATASRDLKRAVEAGVLETAGENNKAQYSFK